MNENKIMDCKTINDLQSIFDNIFTKTYDHENFLENVKFFEKKFYSRNSYLEQFFVINKDNSWDIKRRQISDSLKSHFAPIENENINFLGQLKKLKFSIDENFIDNYEDLLNKEFSTIRKLYSKKNYDTPDINHDEEYNNIISGNKYKIAICISDFKYFSDNLKNSFSNISKNSNNNDDMMYAYMKFTNDKFPKNFNFQPEPNEKSILLRGFINGLSKFDIYHYDFRESYPSFLYIFLYTKQGYLIGSFNYEIVDKEIFKVETMYSENLNKPSFCTLEIKIVKAYTSKVSQNDLDLKIFLFRPPKYLYNYELDNSIDETGYNDIDILKIKKYTEIYNKYFENEILEKNFIDNKSFMKDQLMRNNLTLQLEENLENNYLYFKSNEVKTENILNTFVSKFINFNSTNNLSNNNNKILPESSIFSNLNNQATNIIENLVDNFSLEKESEGICRTNTIIPLKNSSHDLGGLEFEPDFLSYRKIIKIKNNVSNKIHNSNTEIKNILKKWIAKNDTSFEEILYSLVLIDTYSITIYDKLHLLYQIGKMSNFALCSKDNLTLKKLKEMMYSLYKRFMINFNKSEIDIMIDYLIKKEEFACIRNALIYNVKDESVVNKIVNENIFDRKESIITENIQIYIQNYFNLFKNYYLAEKININYFNSIWDLFYPKLLKKLKIKPNEILEKWNFDKMIIDFTSDNIRKTNEYRINLTDKDTFKIYHINLHERINKDPKQVGVKKVMEELISEDLNSINLTNINSDDSINISYDKFKEVFFNLPLISEFIRSTSVFTEENFEALNKKMNMVKVHLNVGNQFRYFCFTEVNYCLISIFIKNIYF